MDNLVDNFRGNIFIVQDDAKSFSSELNKAINDGVLHGVGIKYHIDYRPVVVGETILYTALITLSKELDG